MIILDPNKSKIQASAFVRTVFCRSKDQCPRIRGMKKIDFVHLSIDAKLNFDETKVDVLYFSQVHNVVAIVLLC